jgi:hypothetical protein
VEGELKDEAATMRSFEECSKEELADILERVRDALYLDSNGSGLFYDPDKEWDSDTLDDVAGAIERFRPTKAG